MKKIIILLLVSLQFIACSKDNNSNNEGDTVTPNEVAEEILWGTWTFSYVTNTMEGIRSYTFDQDGKYSYLDRWTTRDSEWNILSQEQSKKDGTYSVQTYTKKDINNVEGIVVIGEKEVTFSVAKSTDGNTYLNLDGVETYTKQLPTQ